MSEEKQKYILTRNVLPMKAGETVELTDKQAASALYATRIRKRDSEMVNQVADTTDAQAQADKLIADAQAEAQAEAEKLIADAQAEAERIISEAEATAEELVKAAVESKPAKK